MNLEARLVLSGQKSSNHHSFSLPNWLPVAQFSTLGAMNSVGSSCFSRRGCIHRNTLAERPLDPNNVWLPYQCPGTSTVDRAMVIGVRCTSRNFITTKRRLNENIMSKDQGWKDWSNDMAIRRLHFADWKYAASETHDLSLAIYIAGNGT